MKFLINDDDLKQINENNPPKHTQLIFRAYNGIYFSEGKLEQKKGLRLLKKMSCKGCSVCDYIFEEEFPQWCTDVGELGDIENGKLYELILTYVPPSWTDYGYEYEGPILNFIEIKED